MEFPNFAAARQCSAGGEGGELLRIGGTAGPARLSVLCGGRDDGGVAALQAADFTVAAARRTGTPLAMVVCAVGRHSWPLARDSPVLRVGPRKFTFAFPGYFLALALPEGCFDRDVGKLELVLATFCAYADHAGDRDADFCLRKPGSNFWASAHADIERLSFPRPSPPSPAGAGPPSGRGWPPQATVKVLQRASRTSAATKLVAKILACGGPPPHVEVLGPAAAAAAAFRRGSPYIFPSLRAVSDVVDAVEAARDVGSGSWSIAPDRWAAAVPEGVLHWHFGVSGVMRILRAVAAACERNGANACAPPGTGLIAELVGGGGYGFPAGPPPMRRPSGGDAGAVENADGSPGDRV